jgi:hypothetical protein
MKPVGFAVILRGPMVKKISPVRDGLELDGLELETGE